MEAEAHDPGARPEPQLISMSAATSTTLTAPTLSGIMPVIIVKLTMLGSGSGAAVVRS